MSMIISITCHDGIVMAADRARSKHVIMNDPRLMANAMQNKILQDAILESHANGDHLSFCYSDTETKIDVLRNNIAVSMGGMFLANGGIIKPHLDHFFNTHEFRTAKEAAEGLLEFLKTKHPGLKAGFHVCGYMPMGDNPPLPCMYFVNTENYTVKAMGENGDTGILQHAANQIMMDFSKAMAGNIRWFTIQDMIDYAAFAIKGSAMYEKYVLLNNRIQGLDILVITPKGIEWVKKTELGVSA
jgi:hypothetical protein